MIRMLLGQETELFFTVTGKNGKKLNRREFIHQFFRLARRLPHLPGPHDNGIFLTGGYLYLDHGEHVEAVTVECCTPRDLLASKLAVEQIISQIVDDIVKMNPDAAELVLSKVNVDYTGMQSTWGEHESYLIHTYPRRFDEHQLIPHLVSRILYTGAGGWHPTFPGLSFLVSPRVPFYTHVVSEDSTKYRGIFHTKDESLAGPEYKYKRLHLICGEGLYSHRASLLKAGATALVVRLVNLGKRPGERVRLSSPLENLKTLAGDVQCTSRIRTLYGEKLTAVEIQRHYLSEIGKHITEMPAWAPEICSLWEETLDALEKDPHSLNRVLDWPTKLEIFSQSIESWGFSWDETAAWNSFFKEVNDAIDPAPDINSVKGWLKADVDRPSRLRFLRILRKHGLYPERLDAFLALREKLFETDIRCGQIGEKGIFSILDRQGLLRHHVDGINDETVGRAGALPSRGSRARIRAECIQRLSGTPERYKCSWTQIDDFGENRVLNLKDPFEAKERWESCKAR